MNKKDLQERLQRYSRFLESEDAQKTLDEMDALFGLNANVFSVLRSEGIHADKQVYAREGARAYSDALRNLVNKTKKQMEMINE